MQGESKTTYTITTDDPRIARLMANADKLACALYDILGWERQIYNGKDYCDGYFVYSDTVLGEAGRVETASKDLDWEKVEKYYSQKEVLRKLEDFLDPVREAVNDYMIQFYLFKNKSNNQVSGTQEEPHI